MTPKVIWERGDFRVVLLNTKKEWVLERTKCRDAMGAPRWEPMSLHPNDSEPHHACIKTFCEGLVLADKGGA